MNYSKNHMKHVLYFVAEYANNGLIIAGDDKRTKEIQKILAWHNSCNKHTLLWIRNQRKAIKARGAIQPESAIHIRYKKPETILLRGGRHDICKHW